MQETDIHDAIEEARQFGVKINLELIKRPTRVSEVVFQRAVFCLLMRRKGYTLLDIATYLKRVHASIIYLSKYHEGKCSKGFRDRFRKIMKKLNQQPINVTKKNAKTAPYKADIKAKLIYHTTMANHYANLL